LRGKFKKIYQLKKDKQYVLDVAAVGDNVEYDLNEDGTGTITSIFERKNHLSRKAPRIKGASHRGERLEQIIASNIDTIFIVSSVLNPSFNNRLIDRIIVVAESSHITPVIVINKSDYKVDVIDYYVEMYEKIGYKVVMTSAVKKSNLHVLQEMIEGKTSILWGSSGVGKSSLLNAIYPDLNLKVGEISKASSKGKHTTVTVKMNRIDDDTYIIDTPGIREIDPYGIKKHDLSHYFIEFNEYQNQCRFNTCTHHHEPKCAVIEAVENDEIDLERYQSYLNILESVEDDMFF
jgi:ribosome biogenesis GTPase